MNKTCLYCGVEMDCKRHSKKYCNDKCKQLAYLKRSSAFLSTSENQITIDTNEVLTEESEIEKLLNEISVRVAKLQELQKKQTQKNTDTKLCMPANMGIQKYTPVN